MPTPLLTRRRCLAGLLAWGGMQATGRAAPATPPRAALLAQPHGEVVLSVSGQIRRTNADANADARADFDIEMLAALPQDQIVTHTPWHQGPQSFGGPLLRDLLAEVGASGRRLIAVALNDYRCEIPVEDTAFDGCWRACTTARRCACATRAPVHRLPFTATRDCAGATTRVRRGNCAA
jgi:hypothetical protein